MVVPVEAEVRRDGDWKTMYGALDEVEATTTMSPA
jgi:hypothetical protein